MKKTQNCINSLLAQYNALSDCPTQRSYPLQLSTDDIKDPSSSLLHMQQSFPQNKELFDEVNNFARAVEETRFVQIEILNNFSFFQDMYLKVLANLKRPDISPGKRAALYLEGAFIEMKLSIDEDVIMKNKLDDKISLQTIQEQFTNALGLLQEGIEPVEDVEVESYPAKVPVPDEEVMIRQIPVETDRHQLCNLLGLLGDRYTSHKDLDCEEEFVFYSEDEGEDLEEEELDDIQGYDLEEIGPDEEEELYTDLY